MSNVKSDAIVILSHPPYTYIHLSLVRLDTITKPKQQQQQQQQQQVPLDPVTLLSYLNSALQSYLGLTGTAIRVDVLKTRNQDAWIRMPFQDANAVVASISQWSSGGVQLRIKGRGTWLGGLLTEESL